MCDHRRIVGDNYGQTCRDCGEVVAGYGYGGWFGTLLTQTYTCVHVYVGDFCLYCERPKEIADES